MISTRHRFAGGSLAALAAGGLLLAGGGIAAADTPPPPPSAQVSPSEPPNQITLSPELSARICDERIPALLERIDDLDARLSGDAETPGSTAWLRARVDQARDEGREAAAERLENRLDNRTVAAERLDGARDRVESFRDEQCS